jgi:hypothetical protein
MRKTTKTSVTIAGVAAKIQTSTAARYKPRPSRVDQHARYWWCNFRGSLLQYFSTATGSSSLTAANYVRIAHFYC